MLNVTEIFELLSSKYSAHLYQLRNCYVFAPDWESDWLHMTRTGYFHEIEIKLTRSDFLADMKKINKHRMMAGYKKDVIIVPRGRFTEFVRLPDGVYRAPYTRIEIVQHGKAKCPNKFYYCAPQGIVTEKDVPEYAGLISIVPTERGHRLVVVKEAPYLHKTKLDLTKDLLNKFYYKCLNLQRKDYLQSHQLKLLQKKYDALQHNQRPSSEVL